MIVSCPVADVVPLPFPELFATVIHPQIEIRTEDARAVMSDSVPLRTAVRQWGNVGALVAGLAGGDYGLIARSLEDFVAEPFRKSLILGFDEVKRASLDAGALGGGISGSGPSIFMLCRSAETAETVRAAMIDVYKSTGIDFNTYVSPINRSGACISK